MMQALAMVILFVFTVPVDARVRRIKSLNEMMTRLATAPYSVILFLDKNKESMRDQNLKQRINDTETMFRSISENPTYKDAGLQFMSVDIARDNLVSVARKYSIAGFPAVLAFSGMQSVGNNAIIQGAIYRDNVETYINTHLGLKIKEILKEKDEARQRELERAQIRAAYWPYMYAPYWYYGYNPYWGFGYPYGPWGGFYW